MVGLALVLLLAQKPKHIDFLGSPSDWIQQPTSFKALLGKVVLIDFWDYTCINCTRTDPYLKEWYRRYHDKGLEIVGVHTPEFEFAKNPDNVRAAVKRNGFAWHILNDPKKNNWYQFGVFAWPERILFDSRGAKQLNQVGEGGYGKMEQEIQREIRELHPGMKLPPLMAPVRDTDKPGAVCRPVTPEIYTWIKGIPGHHVQFMGADIGRTAIYRYPAKPFEDCVMLSGTWTPQKHFLESNSGGQKLRLRYQAKEINVVLYADAPVVIYIDQDGAPLKKSDFGTDVTMINGRPAIRVAQPRMYSIVRNQSWKHGALEMTVLGPGVRFYSFSFGTDCAQ